MREWAECGVSQDRAKAYLSTLIKRRDCGAQGQVPNSDDDDGDEFLLTAARPNEETEFQTVSMASSDELDDPVLPPYNQDEEGYTDTDTSTQV